MTAEPQPLHSLHPHPHSASQPASPYTAPPSEALTRRRLCRPPQADLTCLVGRQCLHILPPPSGILHSLLLSLFLSLSHCNCHRLCHQREQQLHGPTSSFDELQDRHHQLL
uniref:Uncharacterized protein n=1 Tax=Mesocestoides corti TaxID=53468 RepID=A0A5K3G646_MESCO